MDIFLATGKSTPTVLWAPTLSNNLTTRTKQQGTADGRVGQRSRTPADILAYAYTPDTPQIAYNPERNLISKARFT